ncbi:MAG: cold shock domain-containing protein [Methylomonas sp.]|jgi:cold shock CspA family protein
MANAVYKGVLKTWKEDRGFGFIKPDNGQKDIFVHISSLKGLSRRPNRGDILYYEIAKDGDGKFKAVNVRTEAVHISSEKKRKWLLWGLIACLGLGLIIIMAASYLNNR